MGDVSGERFPHLTSVAAYVLQAGSPSHRARRCAPRGSRRRSWRRGLRAPIRSLRLIDVHYDRSGEHVARRRRLADLIVFGHRTPQLHASVGEPSSTKCTEKNLSSVFAERRLLGTQFSPVSASANDAAQLEASRRAARASDRAKSLPNVKLYTHGHMRRVYHLPSDRSLSQSQSSSFGASMGVPPLAMSSSTEYADDLGLGIATLASFGRIERIDARISCSSPELSASDLSPA